MVFSSMLFVFAFFAVNILVHSLCRSMKAKNICLLVSSLIFYSWSSLGFVAIMLFDVAVCWFFALKIEKREERIKGSEAINRDEKTSREAQSNRDEKIKRGLLIGCIAIVILVLGVFKYTEFILENFRLFTGIPKEIPEIALPLGISFYTFQLISYVVDVYRGKVAAQRQFWMLLLYASLFHQCVAGPIVRYGDIEKTLKKRHTTTGQLSRGISRFTVGLAKKAILANSCAIVADTFFKGDASALAAAPAAGLWISGLAYMLQIYLDFSAYSDMARGMGLMCGFHYPENFNYPYIAGSIKDFWKRWHITLSSFFRDYVYIPMGGSHCGRGRQIFNLLVVWFLTGLWHGASWNYILWGLYFFVILVIEKFVIGERLQKIPALIRHIAVLIIVYFCWIIFRFEDLSSLGTVLLGMFCLNGNPLVNLLSKFTLKSNWLLLLVSIIGCTPLCSRIRRWLKNQSKEHTAVMWIYAAVEIIHPVLLLILSAMVLTGNSYNPFIYWNF